MPRPTEEREGSRGKKVMERDKEIEESCNTEKGRADENMGKGTERKERSEDGGRG